jgi:dipeptidyl aminopeptidase/acylaminoacyl peptidase
MKKSLAFMLIVLFVGLFSGCANEVVFDKENNLQLYYVAPASTPAPNGYPAIIFIHGYNGTKQEMLQLAIRAAQKGYFAISIDWRQPNKSSVMWPQLMDDVQNAIFWLIKDTSYASNWSIANPYKIDITRIGAAGFSCGGITSLMLMDFDKPPIKALAAFAAPTDMESEYRYLAFSEKGDENDPNPLDPKLNVIAIDFIENLVGPYKIKDVNNDGIPDYDPKYYEASPINHINTKVPLLLIDGSLDIAVPPSQGRIMMRKVRELGGICDMFIFNMGHSMYPGLATATCPSKEMDVNSGIEYTNTEGNTGLGIMFEFFKAKL